MNADVRKRAPFALFALLLGAGALTGCLAPGERVTYEVSLANDKTVFPNGTEILPGLYSPAPGEDARRAMYHREAFFEVLGYWLEDEGRRVRVDFVANRPVNITVTASGGIPVANFSEVKTHTLAFNYPSLREMREASFMVTASYAGKAVSERALAFAGPKLEGAGVAEITCLSRYHVKAVVRNTGDLPATFLDATVAGHIATPYAFGDHHGYVLPGQAVYVDFVTPDDSGLRCQDRPGVVLRSANHDQLSVPV